MNGVANPWVVFVEAIVAKENLPSWDMIWNDFVQEETRRGLVQRSSSITKTLYLYFPSILGPTIPNFIYEGGPSI